MKSGNTRPRYTLTYAIPPAGILVPPMGSLIKSRKPGIVASTFAAWRD